MEVGGFSGLGNILYESGMVDTCRSPSSQPIEHGIPRVNPKANHRLLGDTPVSVFLLL